MKQIWVVYVKSSEIEVVRAFLKEEHAKDYAECWGEYAMIIPVKKPETIMNDVV